MHKISRQTRSVTVWTVTAIVLIVLLIFWELAANRSPYIRFFFSSPSEIVAAFYRGFASGVALADLEASARATLAGLALGFVLGSLVGLFALALPVARSPISGAVLVLGALPILAVAPMFLIWFGTGLSLKIALAAVLTAVVFAAQTMRVDSAIGPDLREMLEANRIPPSVHTAKVTFPIGIQWVLAEFPSATNAAFLGVFVGEFIAADRGIGYRILRSGALYQVDVVLAQTVTALLMLLAIQVVVRILRSQIVRLVQAASLDPVFRKRGPSHKL